MMMSDPGENFMRHLDRKMQESKLIERGRPITIGGLKSFGAAAWTLAQDLASAAMTEYARSKGWF